MKKKLVNVLAILVMAFVFTTPASANSPDVATDSLEYLAEQVEKTSQISDEKQKEFFAKKSEELLKANKGESKEEAALHITPDRIIFSKVKLLKYENENEFGYIVSFPVTLENSHEISNVSFVFNDKKQFLNTAELYLTENNEGNFNIAQYFDGKESMNMDTDIPFETAEEFRNNQPEISPLAFDINKLASCLGVSVGLATIIASACGVGCYFTGGLGCLACMSFVAGFNIGGGISCFKYAWK
ncbi:hypothetical protein L1I79_38220 [Strepomyces sp. STD 3.1]|nr:hypothetical protein [Streptomyces sp. STD 3.1]